MPLFILSSRLKPALLALMLIGATLLSACGPRIEPLDHVVFGDEPLKQIAGNPDTFKQVPQEDMQLLIAYLAVNEKSRLSGGQFSEIQGKSLFQVVQESRTWQVAMQQVLDESKKIADSISSQVTVIPVDKVMEDGDSPLGKARILKISYQVSNKSARPITGVQGNIKYFAPDGHQVAMIQVIFDRRIEPGAILTLFGHSPILVGSRATKDMVDFAEAPVNQYRFEFVPLALRYDNGDILRVPAL